MAVLFIEHQAYFQRVVIVTHALLSFVKSSSGVDGCEAEEMHGWE